MADDNPFDSSGEDGGGAAAADSYDSLDAEIDNIPKMYDMGARKELIDDLNTEWLLSEDGLAAKERELAMRAKSLQKREGALMSREKELKSKVIGANWPKCCPLVYHNIGDQIPEEPPMLQRCVRGGYYLWYIYCVTLIYNAICLLAAWILDGDAAVFAGSFFLALFLAVILIPLSFFNYRLLYMGARRGKASLYMLFFIILWLFQILPCIFFALGIPTMPAAGWFLLTNSAVSGDGVATVLIIICAVLWTLLAIAYVVLFFLVRPFFSNAGGTSAAKQEGASKAMQVAADNPDVLAAGAKHGAKAAANNPDLAVKAAKHAV